MIVPTVKARPALALLAGALLFGVAASAQPARTPNAQPLAPTPAKPAPPPAERSLVVGVIDIGAVLRQSTAAQDLQRQLQIEQDKFQVEFDQVQRDLRVAEEDIERERASQTPESFAERRRLFQERVNKAGSDFRLRRQQLEEAFTKANEQVTRTLFNVIDELASSKGIGVVLRQEAVLFQKNAIDLTPGAVDLLNSKLPTAGVVLPGSR